MRIQTTDRKFFKNLDALRFLAFLFIFLTHSLQTDSSVVAQNPIQNWLDESILVLAKIGFSFMFVLSGFLNTWVILEEKKLTGNFKPWKYYIRRAIRIWPVYFLVLIIGFIVIPAIAGAMGLAYQETGNPLWFIFFLGNFFIIENGFAYSPVLTVLWSVSVEEQFYLLWPFLMILLWNKRLLLLAFMTVIFAITTFHYYDSDVNLWYHPFFLLADIVAGAFFAFMAFDKRWMYDRLIKMPRWFNGSNYLLLAVIFAFYTPLFNGGLLPGALNLVFEKLIITFILGYIIFEQCFGQNKLLEFGNSKLFTRLGVIGYGLYCYHEIALLISHNLIEMVGLKNDVTALIIGKPIIAFALLWPMAELSWKYFEKPLLKLKRHFYG
ncbi:MAG: peptidoglycan/LPS O-acetylase OafA/YrhL [Bacteroidia bacterium]|jgi:peptidoglycan/LPS O-acetylase OafA/YrhL